MSVWLCERCGWAHHEEPDECLECGNKTFQCEAETEAKVEIVKGVEGVAVYINDLRVAGPKPLGGGKCIFSQKVPISQISEAIED